MKYLISESKLESLIYKQIDKLDELKGLKEFDCSHFDWDLSVSVDVYCFQKGPYDDPIMEYILKPDSIPIDKEYDVDYQMYYDSLPGLVLDNSITSYLNDIFGDSDSWRDVFKVWFEENYNHKVENIW